jgi:hypothetical protein
MAAVENTAPSSGCSISAWGFPAARTQHCGQRTRPLVSGSFPGPREGALQCLLSVARTSLVDRRALAQPARIAVYGPVCTVVWQGSAVTAAPMPIAGACAVFAPSGRARLAYAKVLILWCHFVRAPFATVVASELSRPVGDKESRILPGGPRQSGCRRRHCLVASTRSWRAFPFQLSSTAEIRALLPLVDLLPAFGPRLGLTLGPLRQSL